MSEQKAKLVIVDPACEIIDDALEIVGKDIENLEIRREQGLGGAVKGVRAFSMGVLLVSITNKLEFDQTIKVLNLFQQKIRDRELKTVVVATIADEKIKKSLFNHGVTEILTDKSSASALAHKIKIQFKTIAAAQRAAQAKGETNQVKEAPFDLIAPLTTEHDTWRIDSLVPKVIAGNWSIELRGPDPSSGGWTERENDTGDKFWEWTLKVAGDPTHAWYFQGKLPEFDPKTRLWKFISNFPALSASDVDGNQLGYKFVLEEGTLHVAADTEIAKKNIEKSLLIAAVIIRKKEQLEQAKQAAIAKAQEEAVKAEALKVAEINASLKASPADPAPEAAPVAVKPKANLKSLLEKKKKTRAVKKIAPPKREEKPKTEQKVSGIGFFFTFTNMLMNRKDRSVIYPWALEEIRKTVKANSVAFLKKTSEMESRVMGRSGQNEKIDEVIPTPTDRRDENPPIYVIWDTEQKTALWIVGQIGQEPYGEEGLKFLNEAVAELAKLILIDEAAQANSAAA